MSTNIQSSRSQTELRAIQLLGSGLPAATVATALNVSESRISQFLADKSFADEVSKLRFENLQKHNEQDNLYDEMENKVALQLKELIPLITRPGELLKAAQVLNSMKRRGQSSPDQMVAQNQVVQLLMPTVITQKFTKNVNNQVIVAGTQTLETIQGSTLLAAAKAKAQVINEAGHGLHNQTPEYTESRTIGTERASPEVIQARVAALTNATTATGDQTERSSTGAGTAAIYAKIPNS